jgi:hypothetical protein
MAKRDKVLPARKPRDRARDDESLLIRSAETLGRTIGSLQRQLDGATRRLSETAADVVDTVPDMPLVGGAGSRRRGATGKKKAAKSKETASRRRSAGTRAPAARKRTRARAAATTRSSKKR